MSDRDGWPDSRVDGSPPDGALAISLAGETVWLLPDRAVFLPGCGELLIADPHFGKAAVFRQHGIALPAGTTSADLRRLDGLLRITGARRLSILGDFLHGRPRADDPWLRQFAEWRRHWPAVHLRVIIGNHDRPWVSDWQSRMGCLPHDHWLTEADAGPFRLSHEPRNDVGRHVLCGHLHPVYTLRGQADRLRLPVFWRTAGHTVLPGFGGLTGGWPVVPSADDGLYAIGPDRVIDISAAASAQARRACMASRRQP
jgi:uncharacterized protein